VREPTAGTGEAAASDPALQQAIAAYAPPSATASLVGYLGQDRSV
jgi:hypothetical protein